MATPDGYSNWTEYIGSVGTLNGIENLPTFLSAKESMGDAGLLVLGISDFCGIATGLVGNIVALSRLLFSMSRDDLLPKQFQYKNKKGVPYVAVGFIAAVSLPIPFFGRTAIGWIVDVTTIGAAIVYVYTSICSFVTGKREKKRGMQVSGIIGTVISLIFVGFYLLPSLWSQKSTLAAESFLILIIWCLLGMIVFRLLIKRDKTRRFGKSEVVWIILLFLILLLSIVWVFQTTTGEASNIAQDVCTMQKEQAVKAGLSPDNNNVIETGNYITQRVMSFGENVRLNILVQAILIFCSIAVIFSIFSIIKKREQVIEAERILAEENSRAKSAFLSNMSHDLRTPVNAVTGYTALALKEENLPDNIRDYLLKIDNSGKHLLSLINDILDMSRIESGKAELRCEPSDICLLLDEAESLFAVQISGKKLRFDVSCSEIKDRYVVCDKNIINRILLNLISNAIKFTPAGGSISVELRQTKSENGEAYFVLTVADTGIGMSKEFSKHIFDAFERERSSTVSNIQGTGLGMSITKGFTELMGGTIEVETEEGKGTKFTLNLHFPVASEDEIAQLTEVVDETPDDFSGKRLLLVEDNPVNTEIAKMILSMSGFECDCAENGKEAVDMVEKTAAGDYCAILMDVRMPVMNGLEAARAIRALDGENSKLPIIAVSANTFESDRREAFDAGMNDHISKPLQPDVLIATLRKYIK